MTLRIVIGEDQALLREGIVRLLEDAGFEVVAEAGDGEVPEPEGALVDRVDAIGGVLERDPRGLRLEVPCAS